MERYFACGENTHPRPTPDKQASRSSGGGCEVVITGLTRKTFSFIPLEFRKPLILLRFRGFRMYFHKTSSRSFLAKLQAPKFHTERYRSGHNGADSKSVCAKAHGGSNPPLSAIALKPLCFKASSLF